MTHQCTVKFLEREGHVRHCCTQAPRATPDVFEKVCELKKKAALSHVKERRRKKKNVTVTNNGHVSSNQSTCLLHPSFGFSTSSLGFLFVPSLNSQPFSLSLSLTHSKIS